MIEEIDNLTDTQKLDLTFSRQQIFTMLGGDRKEQQGNVLIEKVAHILTGDPKIPSSIFATRKLQQLLMSSESTLNEITEIIALDPGLTSRFLTLSRSAIYRGANITSLQDSLSRIGLQEVRKAALGYMIKDAFREFRAEIDWDNYWFQSILAGRLMERICSNFRAIDGSEYLIGMLHNIGVLVLLEYFPAEYERVSAMVDEGVPRQLAEIEVFGISHEIVSGVLCMKWIFPTPVSKAVEHHHAPFAGQHSDAVKTLAVAIYMTDRLIATSYGIETDSYLSNDALYQSMEWQWLIEKTPNRAIQFDMNAEIEATQQIISNLA